MYALTANFTLFNMTLFHDCDNRCQMTVTCRTSSDSLVDEYSVPYHCSTESVLPANFLPITDILHSREKHRTLRRENVRQQATQQVINNDKNG